MISTGLQRMWIVPFLGDHSSRTEMKKAIRVAPKLHKMRHNLIRNKLQKTVNNKRKPFFILPTITSSRSRLNWYCWYNWKAVVQIAQVHEYTVEKLEPVQNKNLHLCFWINYCRLPFRANPAAWWVLFKSLSSSSLISISHLHDELFSKVSHLSYLISISHLHLSCAWWALFKSLSSSSLISALRLCNTFHCCYQRPFQEVNIPMNRALLPNCNIESTACLF